MSKRLVLVPILAVALLALTPSQPRASATTALLTRIQIRVTTSSDWTSVTVHHLDVRARRTVSATSAQAVWEATDGWTIVRVDGAPASTVVLDLIAELAPSEVPDVAVAKGRVGVADVDVVTTSGPQPRPVVHLALDTHDPYRNVVTSAMARDALLSEPLLLPEVDDRNLALAFYYPWFRADAASDPKVNPDKPGSWYATDDREHVRGMVAEAAGAGLDGFIVSWEGARHGAVVDRLVDEVAQRPGFALAPLLELRAMRTKTVLGDHFDPATAASALIDFEQRVPAGSRLQVGGRPVVVAFGMWDLQPAEWAAFLARLGDRRPFIIGDRDDAAFAIDGLYQYDPNGRSVDQLDSDYESAVDRARLQPAIDPTQRRLLWAATVSPGLDNRASTLLLDRRFTDRAGGWRYDQTWRVALESQPEWVFVTSWNEWFEQTHISPGRTTGRAALDQTTAWTGRFHASPQ